MGVKWASDVSGTAWVLDALDDHWISQANAPHTVATLVPRGYEAHVRLLHPIENGPESPMVRLAERNGWRVHPEMKLNAIRKPAPGAPDPVEVPAYATVDSHTPPEVLEPLIGHLRRHTTTPERCTFVMWMGYAELAALDPEVRGLPTVILQGNGHHVFEGPLEAAAQVTEPLADSPPYTPNLWWPDDRTWVVGRNIEDDGTFVAGTAELAGDLLSDGRLEVLLTEPGHSPNPFTPDPINDAE